MNPRLSSWYHEIFYIWVLTYSRVPLYRGQIDHDITHVTASTAAELKLNFKDELWGVYYEDFEDNWPHNNSTAL